MGGLNLALANMQGWCGNSEAVLGSVKHMLASMIGHLLLTDTLQSQSDSCQPLWSPRQRHSSLWTLSPSYSPWLDIVVILGRSDRNAFEYLPLCPWHTVPVHLSLFQVYAASQLCQSGFSRETEPRGIILRICLMQLWAWQI